MGSCEIARGLAAAVIAGCLNSAALAQPATAPFMGTGAFPAISEPAPGLATHTLYVPKDMDGVKGKLPVVAWANGACRNENTGFRTFLTEIASHGYAIVAIGPYSDAPARVMVEPRAMPAPAPRPAGANAPPPQETKASQLIDALDWAQAENARAGSPLRGRLDLGKVAVMGQSCGGLQTMEVAGDPRIKTVVLWDSGLMPSNGGYSPPKALLKTVHTPIAYFIGGPTDIAWPNANDDFEQLQGVPVLLANLPLGHTGNYGLPRGGPFAAVGVAWLDWQLKGDPRAKAVFAGEHCGLCGDPAWTVQRKNIP